MKKQIKYLSYLLRLWQESSEEQAVWRASLESPGSGEVQGFAGLGDLVAFLEREIRAGSWESGRSRTDRRHSSAEQEP